MDSPFKLLEDAIASGKAANTANPKNWPEPIVREADDVDKQPNLIEGAYGIIADIAREAAAGIQFPVSTAYAHGLGILASAMTRSFRVKHVRYDGDVASYSRGKACNLYVVTSQPPSTGKSSVHNAFQGLVCDAFQSLNKKLAKQLREITEKIDALKAEKKACENPQRASQISAVIYDLEQEAKDFAPVEYTYDDATPEALDAAASAQSGFWTVTSSEAQALSTLIGGSYLAQGKDTNANMLLKSWDMESVSTARVGRKGNSGTVYASIAVIAQDDTIDTLMSAAKRDIGITERFLIFQEKNMFGERNHENPTYHMSAGLAAQYREMIFSIVLGGGTLVIGPSFDRIVGKFLNTIEPHLADGGRLGHPTVRGFYGKGRNHITKLACVLHVAKEWGPGGSKAQDVSDETAYEAIALFKKFGFIYRRVVDESGASGAKTERETLLKALIGLMERKKRNFFKNEEIRQLIKNNAAFKTRPKINQYLRENCFPELQADGYIYQVEAGIYVNPLICR